MSAKRILIFVLGYIISLGAQGQSEYSGAEYSWDSGTAIPLIAFDGDFNSAVEDIVSSSSLTFPSGGLMSSTFVFKMKICNWSPNFKRIINFPVTDYTRDHYITQAEYFWDNDQVKGMAFR